MFRKKTRATIVATLAALAVAGAPEARAQEFNTNATIIYFDAAGNETTIDYDRVFAILDAAGYNGCVGIEFEGKGMPEHAGILATKRLLERLGVRA